MTLPVAYLWLIPALPLAAAAIGAVTPRRGRRLAAGCAIVALGASLVLAVVALAGVLRSPEGATPAFWNFVWFRVGAGTIRLGWLLDPLAGFVLVMVTLVGLLIFIFSLGYMREDPNAARFFCFLSLFAAGMLGLVIANSLLLLFICWETVGLASYLLIGFWFDRPKAAAAARKAFIVTRLGDLALLLGMLWLYHAAGTLVFYNHGGSGCLEPAALSALAAGTVAGGMAVSTAISLLVFAGAVGKSGQVPLHVWLPDAMEGPTPVSALIHAATMVAAGVYLVARVYPLMAADQTVASHGLHALTVVAFTGAVTALVGALIAMAQNDIKRVLAYSTVSQLGYMMLALGVGAWAAAIFHLLTHAFFKALLFLGAGSVIHATHHEQDIRHLGGLGPRMRITFATFAAGMMALAGVPFFFSGFWSKEEILHGAYAWPVSSIPFVLGLTAVLLTAFYMTRLVAEVFFGTARSEAAGQAHESPAVMTWPLAILAVFAVGLGFLGTPAWPWLESRFAGTAPVGNWSRLLEGWHLMVPSILLVGAGLGLGWWLYGRRPRRTASAPDPLGTAAPAGWAALGAGLGFDRLYDLTVIRFTRWAAAFADGCDRWVWDGVIRFLALSGKFAGVVSRQTDESGLNDGFDRTCEDLREVGQFYAKAQSGDAHVYLRLAAVAFVVLVLLLSWGASR